MSKSIITLAHKSKMKNGLAFLFFGLAIYSNSLNAQTKLSNVQLKNTPDSFDLSASTLPKNFKGHSLALLQDKLHKKFLRIKPKSKFESDEEFRSRLDQERESIAKEPLLGTLTLKDKWIFVFNPGFEYDAERKGFSAKNESDPHIDSIWFYADGLYADNDDLGTSDAINSLLPKWVINFQIKSRKTGNYLVQNYLGMQFRVTKHETFSRSLRIASCKKDDFVRDDFVRQLQRSSWSNIFETFVPASSERAKSMDGNLRYLLVMEEFVPPYFTAIKSTAGPSVPDDLEESFTHHTMFFGKLSSLWIFNIKTGEVIEKHSPCEVKSMHENVRNLYLF